MSAGEDNRATATAGLRAHLAELDTIYGQHAVERDKHRFAERFRRWKQRTAATVERVAGPLEAKRFRELSDSWVAVDQHRDREVHPHRNFVEVLAEEIEARGAEFSDLETPTEMTPLTAAPKHVFLSHAAADAPLAEFIREQVLMALPGTDVFQASLPGQIPVGRDWLEVIKRELRRADSYIVLVTPQSIKRPWIHFETGAAWMSDKPLFTVTVGVDDTVEVPLPLSSFQMLSLETEREAAAIFQQLHATLTDPAAFVRRIVALMADAASRDKADANWRGIELDGRYFAWQGAGLHALTDRAPIPYPPELPNSLRQVQMAVRLARREKLTSTLGKGWRQVFETDRKTFRREVGDGGGGILMTKPDESARMLGEDRPAT